MKVLFWPRPTVFTHRGGDTILLEKLFKELTALGVECTIDENNILNPKDFALVHLFNFALPQLLQDQAMKVKASGVPFVVTALSEDIECFHTQSHYVARSLIDYVASGQKKMNFSQSEMWNVPHASRFQNDWIMQHASAIFTTGELERESIERSYGSGFPIRTIHLGCDIVESFDASAFSSAYGVSDYVICVGRFESRKNQLMLCKALEDSDLPLVLIGGNITYQPDYAEAVASFKRKGRTIIAHTLTPEMLASAYAGARVHVLPSFYELPGLVTLEAARLGTAVVSSTQSTVRDYLGNLTFYASPWDEEGIRSSVYAAFYSPETEELQKQAHQFNWTRTAEETLAAYKEIVPMSTINERTAKTPAHSSVTVQGVYDASSEATSFVELIEKGEVAARNRSFDEAHELFTSAMSLNHQHPRLLRAFGALKLAQSDVSGAKALFLRAIAIEPQDAKTLSGLGMCEMMEQNFEGAYQKFVASLSISPNQLVPILQLIECSYTLERYSDLESALRSFIASNPADVHMRYCLAACLFKQKKTQESISINNEVLSSDPSHKGALELKERIDSERATSLSSHIVSESVPPTITIKTEKYAPLSSPFVASQGLTKASVELDMKIAHIEEKKRKKEFNEASEILTQVKKSSDVTPHQRDLIRALDIELQIIAGDVIGAKERIAQYLEETPNSPRLVCAKGALMIGEGNLEAAKGQFELALVGNPKSDVALAGLGVIEHSKGNLEAAWGRYIDSLTHNPENGRAMLGAIELGYKLGKLEKLQSIIEAYIELHPADLDMVYSLAGCCFAQGKLEEAKQHLETISLFEPQNERAIELKGMIEAHSFA